MKDLLYEVLSHYGLQEVSGPHSNPDIIAMGDELGIEIGDDSTYSWCSIAMCYYAQKMGYEHPNSPAARSWLTMPIKVLKPTLGDIVVFWRGSPSDWRGHVGIFINWNDKVIWCLGGNQNNRLDITPYSRDRLLGFRRLHKII
jgi:uncharacterized protein (TIGR02594 family)